MEKGRDRSQHLCPPEGILFTGTPVPSKLQVPLALGTCQDALRESWVLARRREAESGASTSLRLPFRTC